MTAQRAHLDFNRAAGGYNSLLFQTPCSWGTVYFPEVWMHLHAALVNQEYVSIPGVLVNGWKESWKKFLFSLMFHNDWYLLYPGYKQVWTGCWHACGGYAPRVWVWVWVYTAVGYKSGRVGYCTWINDGCT